MACTDSYLPRRALCKIEVTPWMSYCLLYQQELVPLMQSIELTNDKVLFKLKTEKDELL